MPGHGAREVSQLDLGQKCDRAFLPAPCSFLLFRIMLRKQPETGVTRNQAFPSTLPWRDSPGPCGHHSNMLSGRHALFSPWIVLMFIEYEQMRCLLNNVQCSIGRSHFCLLLNIHHQIGAGVIGRGHRKNRSSQRGNPQRGSVFCPHHPPDLASEFIFAKGFEGRS